MMVRVEDLKVGDVIEGIVTGLGPAILSKPITVSSVERDALGLFVISSVKDGKAEKYPSGGGWVYIVRDTKDV
jgi:hypothetical protein